MIVVTLICVLLGGVMGRIEYLRRMADFHRRECERYVSEFNAQMPVGHTDENAAEKMVRHMGLAYRYRQAVYRPWAAVDESPPLTGFTHEIHPPRHYAGHGDRGAGRRVLGGWVNKRHQVAA